jgi:hypothetical protein
MEEDFLEIKQVTLDQSESSSKSRCSNKIYNYLENRQNITIRILLFSLLNSIIIFLLSYFRFLIEDKYLNTNFNIPLCISFSCFLMLYGDIPFYYSYSYITKLCKNKNSDDNNTSNKNLNKFLYSCSFIIFIAFNLILIIYWCKFSFQNFTIWILGDFFITLNWILGFKLVKFTNIWKLILMSLIVLFVCNCLYLISYILIFNYEFNLETLKTLFEIYSSSLTVLNFIMFSTYVLIKSFVIFFYYFCNFHFYEKKNSYASSLFFYMIIGYFFSYMFFLVIELSLRLLIIAGALCISVSQDLGKFTKDRCREEYRAAEEEYYAEKGIKIVYIDKRY